MIASRNGIYKGFGFICRQFDPRVYLQAIVHISGLVIRRKGLLWELSKRDIRDRYAGQWLGSLWALIHPFLLICLYIFVFAYVFAIKVPNAVRGTDDFTIYLLSGLLSWMSFQEILGRSPNSIINETSMVKQVVFPVEVIPLKGIFPAVLTQGIATLLLIIFMLFKGIDLSLTLLLWPLLVSVQIFSMVGVALFLSSITPFIRDIKDIVQITTLVAMYAAPIFYSTSMVPSWGKPVLYLNPVTHMVLCYQDVIYNGTFLNPWSWVFFPLFSFAILGIGARAFIILKNFFGNVL